MTSYSASISEIPMRFIETLQRLFAWNFWQLEGALIVLKYVNSTFLLSPQEMNDKIMARFAGGQSCPIYVKFSHTA